MIYNIEPIAYIENDYVDKFGIPRQSGLIDSTMSKIIFYNKYRDENSLHGLEGYSHIWLLWIFSEADSSKEWSPTVRPPRLGGNKRTGVFSTRSPYHPNRIGLSCVKLERIEKSKSNGTVIIVSGADLLNGTPIIDIKPYLSFTDSHPDAVCGFADDVLHYSLSVSYKANVSDIPSETLTVITEILKQDPRPSYHNNSERIYAMDFSDYKIRFNVKDNILYVHEITKTSNEGE